MLKEAEVFSVSGKGAGGAPAGPKVLVVDDDIDVRIYVSRVVRTLGLGVVEAADLVTAAGIVESTELCLVFLDKCLPDGDGVEFSRGLLERFRNLPVVIITGQGSGDEVFTSMEAGVFDYIAKPCGAVKVREIIQRALCGSSVAEQGDGDFLGDGLPTEKEVVLIAKSPAMIEICGIVRKIASMNRHVLIQGATGTGKEVVARKIHELSPRVGKFVDVNCGAIPQELIEAELFGHVAGAFTDAKKERVGLLEEANGGTIFLDEITETSAGFQVKLLKVLQGGKIRRVGSNQEVRLDVRVIGASNRVIASEVEAGRFREDLYFRLKGSEIRLPALKDRREDIIPLAEYFGDRTARRLGRRIMFSGAVLGALRAFDWRGNVRELENVIDYAVQSCNGKILISDLPKEFRDLLRESEDGDEFPMGKSDSIVPLGELELREVKRALEVFGGDKSAAAKALGIQRSTIYRILDRARGVDVAAGVDLEAGSAQELPE